MIQVTNKADCCGCMACASACPKQCISMQEDDEGFMYPVVNHSLCIDCNLCQKVCPVINQGRAEDPLTVYAAINTNEQIRMSSSSGGIFTIIAEKIIADGGAVFGARFNDKWEVIHDYTETAEGLSAFRSSKYVQSRIGDSFTRAEAFLKQGRKVMFTGTPCQIAGLKSFLRKEYQNLLTVDLICHGVPSPKVWRTYLGNLLSGYEPNGKHIQIKSINFRNKESRGWKKFNLVIKASEDNKGNPSTLLSEPFYKNVYMSAFLANLSLRPSCYACPAKAGKAGSDLTLGDFWGVQNILPTFDDDKGCSVILSHTGKGEEIIASLHIDKQTVDYSDVVINNPSIKDSVAIPANRNFFFSEIQKDKTISEAWDNTTSRSLAKRVQRLIYRQFSK